MSTRTVVSETIPVGSRVVLVEDHRLDPAWGRKGWRGKTLGSFPEGIPSCYSIKFDNGQSWWVNASAVALETPADTLTLWERDTALAMALTLADLIRWDTASLIWQRRQQPPFDFEANRKKRVSDWLRDCVRRDLEGQ